MVPIRKELECSKLGGSKAASMEAQHLLRCGILAALCLLWVKTRNYRTATAMAGSPQIADITSTVDGKALGAEGRLV